MTHKQFLNDEDLPEPYSEFQPQYLCWFEGEFTADLYVLTPHQRQMYRSLCQAAFFCSSRPYLPDEDEDLCLLANADSLEHWAKNKDAVMKKFTLVTVRGNRLWAHKRLIADWEKQLAAAALRQKKWTERQGVRKEAGKKGAKARWDQQKEAPGDDPHAHACDSMRPDAIDLTQNPKTKPLGS